MKWMGGIIVQSDINATVEPGIDADRVAREDLGAARGRGHQSRRGVPEPGLGAGGLQEG